MEDYLVTLLEMGRQYQATIAEVNQDTHLSADARRQQIRDASRDFEARYKPERDRILQQLEKDYDRLHSKAYASERSGAGNRMDEAKETLSRIGERNLDYVWEKGDEAILEGYESALERDRSLDIEAYELYGQDKVQDPSLRQEFFERVQDDRLARMSELQRRAVTRFERFEFYRSQVEYRLILQDQVLNLQE